MYRDNPFSKVGDISVSDDKRIYFFSQEGKHGIYSTKLDGTDLKFEVPSKDIHKMQLCGDVLYYLDLDEIFYGDEESSERWGNKCYSLKAYDLRAGTVTEFEAIENYYKEMLYDEMNGISRYRGIWDFHFFNDTEYFVSTIDTAAPSGRFYMMMSFVKDGKVVDLEKESYLEYTDFMSDSKGRASVFTKDNTYIISPSAIILGGNYIKIDSYSIYSENREENYSIFDSILNNSSLPNVYKSNDNDLFMSIGNSLYQCDLGSEEMKATYVVDGAQKLIAFEEGEYVLAVCEDKEAIYRFDSNRKEYFLVAEVQKERIIDISSDAYIVMSEKSIRKMSLIDGKTIWSVDFDSNCLIDECKIEIGGDWIWIKHFDYQKECAELLWKIHIESGKNNGTGHGMDIQC